MQGRTNFQGRLYPISDENSQESQRSLVESLFSMDDQLMDWQTPTTFVILAIAASIMFKRLGAFFRSGKAGSCGSCAGCGDSAKDKVATQLVPLGTDTTQTKITANRSESLDAGAEKRS